MATPETNAPAAKPKKKKGPIRWEAIGPFVIFVALVWAYFFFFFDSHIRGAMEYIGTQANGAEVNVGSLGTSFWKASLDVGKIQVTSASEPAKNKIQIGAMRWQVSWDALLRGKILINTAQILEVAAGAPRAKPGRVLPPPPPPSGKPSAFSKMKEEALARAEQEFSKNVLGDAAGLLKGGDPAAELKNFQGSLKSSLRAKELQAELGKKEKEWKERLDKLPQTKELQALRDRLGKVKLDNFKSPAEVQESLKQIDAILKEADAKYKVVQETQGALNGDVGKYQGAINQLQDMVSQDIKDLEGRLKLPSLDVQSISRTLFGSLVLSRLKQGEFYMNKAREYMPPKKSKDEKTAFVPTPHERAKGRNYKFGRPNSYPLFWLKKAEISSKATPGADWSGDLDGVLKDVTDDQALIGQPTVAQFKGSFPKQGFFGIDGKVTLDHRTETPVESLDLSIASFPVKDRFLVDSNEVKVGIEGAAGNTTIQGKFTADEMKITSASAFQKSETSGATFMKSQSSTPILDEILKGALADVRKVTLNVGVSGKWTAPSFDIDSSLGRDLAAGFKKQFEAKIAEAKKKLHDFVNGQVGAEKEKLMAEFNKQKAMIDNLLKSKQEEINKAKGSIDQAKNDATKNQGKKLEQEGKKALDDIKKKFGF